MYNHIWNLFVVILQINSICLRNAKFAKSNRYSQTILMKRYQNWISERMKD